MSRWDWPCDRAADPLFEQGAWYTQLSAQPDDRHPTRAACGEELAGKLVRLATAEPQHRAGLLHRQEVRGTVIDRNTEICSHNNSCLPNRDFVTPTPTGVEPTPNGGENVTTSPEEYRAGSRQGAAHLWVPCWRNAPVRKVVG